jgi:hypothetical protein
VNWVDVPEGLTANGTTDWLQPQISDDGTGFTLNEVNTSSGSIFGNARAAVFNLAKGRETRPGRDGKSINYFLYELTRDFVPQQTGRYTFGPALLKGAFVGGMQNNEYLARRIVAIASAATVEVREVPAPRPATYSGGIGEYHIAASASPIKLRVGDPLTLTLQFAPGEQSGSLERISAPDLTAIPEIADNFEIIDKSPTGRVESGVKKFGYAMRPKRASVSIPAISVSTFDPTTELFTQISTDAISLEVSEASKLSTSELVGAVPATATNEIQKSSSGIFQNITDPRELRDERVRIGAWLSTVAAFWCVAAGAIAGVIVRRRKSTDTVGQRRAQARRTAMARIAEANSAAASGQRTDALRHVRAAVAGLVADMRDRVADGLTASDVSEELIAASISTDDRNAVTSLLESLEGAQYGGGSAIEPANAIRHATELIGRLSPILERSARR